MKIKCFLFALLSLLSTPELVTAQDVGSCSTDSSGNVVCVDPGPPACDESLRYYVQLADDEENILTRALRARIKEIAADESECADRLREIESSLERFWDTDPYCRQERKDLKKRIEAENIDSKIPEFARRTIDDALDAQNSTCRAGLNAAQSVLSFYRPDLFYFGSPVDYAPSLAIPGKELGSPRAVKNPARSSHRTKKKRTRHCRSR
jgi:hypothetical protein